MDIIEEAKKVFDIEIKALQETRNLLDNTFVSVLDEITNCSGKVIVTGIGKPGHIATKLVATFSSLGTSSFYLHPAEAMHGDLGMISKNDIVIVLSLSGESDEIISILPNIKMIGARIIALTGNKESTLAKYADIVQVFPKFKEACYLGLAPTSSTTVELVYGDALAVVASEIYGFQETDFGRFHPAGALGKKLVIKVKDIMITEDENAVITESSSLKDAIVEISKKAIGMVSVVDDNGDLLGIITSGDLRRGLEKNTNIYNLRPVDLMTMEPCTVSKNKMAVDALSLMIEHNYGVVPVVEKKKLIGAVTMHDIIKAGITNMTRFSYQEGMAR